MLSVIEGMVQLERKKLLAFAKTIVPQLTAEDILQPQDYPELENSPEFRYREGICVGLESALHALYAENNARGVAQGAFRGKIEE